MKLNFHQLPFLLLVAYGCFLSICPTCSGDEPIPLTRMKYNHPGLVVDLGVGLWSWPMPIDYDRDGDLDLVVSCSDVPFNGTYFFENPGSGSGRQTKLPVFEPPVKVAGGIRNLGFSMVDDQPKLMIPGAELTAVFRGDFDAKKRIWWVRVRSCARNNGEWSTSMATVRRIYSPVTASGPNMAGTMPSTIKVNGCEVRCGGTFM